MDQKQVILEYRKVGAIKGHRPGVVFLKKNRGQIYNSGTADFMMSIGKEELYFQRLSFFLKNLLPKKDFQLELKSLKSYNLRQVNPVVECLSLYTTDRKYLEIFFYVGTRNTSTTETNISSIIKMLEERGVNKI